MPDIKEEWRDIEGYEGLYQVSNLGRVKSLKSRWGNRKKDFVLVPRISKNGYMLIGIYKNGKRRFEYIHRLVATAFLKKPSKKCDVNHIDCNKTNNLITNLEWATRYENMKHASKNGLIHVKGRFGTENPNTKLTENQANQIRKDYVPYDKKFGSRALSRKYNVSQHTIWLIIHNQTHKSN